MSRAHIGSAVSAASSPVCTNGTHLPEAGILTQHQPSDTTSQKPLIEPLAEMLALLERVAIGVETLGIEVRRVADHLSPEPGDVVGTPYIAERLACTTVWVTDMARNGQIPKNCILPGTGNGKPWKFHRRGIDEWLRNR